MEAAIAGEQGRGFTAVASEVRTLAQRSAQCLQGDQGLIDDSRARVAEGSVLVDQAGKTKREIVASVQRVTDIMGEISAASQEQLAGIVQLNQTVTHMNETTQQNAALVEEATTAARPMKDQAVQLSDTVTHPVTGRGKAEMQAAYDHFIQGWQNIAGKADDSKSKTTALPGQGAGGRGQGAGRIVWSGKQLGSGGRYRVSADACFGLKRTSAVLPDRQGITITLESR